MLSNNKYSVWVGSEKCAKKLISVKSMAVLFHNPWNDSNTTTPIQVKLERCVKHKYKQNTMTWKFCLTYIQLKTV